MATTELFDDDTFRRLLWGLVGNDARVLPASLAVLNSDIIELVRQSFLSDMPHDGMLTLHIIDASCWKNLSLKGTYTIRCVTVFPLKKKEGRSCLSNLQAVLAEVAGQLSVIGDRHFTVRYGKDKADIKLVLYHEIIVQTTFAKWCKPETNSYNTYKSIVNVCSSK